jgi:chromosome segregation ATPase
MSSRKRKASGQFARKGRNGAEGEGGEQQGDQAEGGDAVTVAQEWNEASECQELREMLRKERQEKKQLREDLKKANEKMEDQETGLVIGDVNRSHLQRDLDKMTRKQQGTEMLIKDLEERLREAEAAMREMWDGAKKVMKTAENARDRGVFLYQERQDGSGFQVGED